VDFHEGVDIQQEVASLISSSARFTSTDAQLILRDRYETLFGIFNHSALEEYCKTNPEFASELALVLQHWSEDTITDGPMHERMTQFVDYGIHKYFGLSFNEFIDQPTYRVQLMLEVAEKRVKAEAEIANTALRGLDGVTRATK
jgi:hypothetical protein